MKDGDNALKFSRSWAPSDVWASQVGDFLRLNNAAEKDPFLLKASIFYLYTGLNVPTRLAETILTFGAAKASVFPCFFR